MPPAPPCSMTQTETRYPRTANSDAQGGYTLPNLPVGPYTLTVTAPGFKHFEQKNILLQVGTNIQINATLEVGAVAESVEVRASAGRVEAKEHTVSEVITERQIVDLPVNARQPTQLIVISGAA